ncbi:MAG: hypothetical protein MHMPM18_000611 [Marteilia pararefringens]
MSSLNDSDNSDNNSNSAQNDTNYSRNLNAFLTGSEESSAAIKEEINDESNKASGVESTIEIHDLPIIKDMCGKLEKLVRESLKFSQRYSKTHSTLPDLLMKKFIIKNCDYIVCTPDYILSSEFEASYSVIVDSRTKSALKNGANICTTKLYELGALDFNINNLQLFIIVMNLSQELNETLVNFLRKNIGFGLVKNLKLLKVEETGKTDVEYEEYYETHLKNHNTIIRDNLLILYEENQEELVKLEVSVNDLISLSNELDNGTITDEDLPECMTTEFSD